MTPGRAWLGRTSRRLPDAPESPLAPLESSPPRHAPGCRHGGARPVGGPAAAAARLPGRSRGGAGRDGADAHREQGRPGPAATGHDRKRAPRAASSAPGDRPGPRTVPHRIPARAASGHLRRGLPDAGEDAGGAGGGSQGEDLPEQGPAPPPAGNGARRRPLLRRAGGAGAQERDGRHLRPGVGGLRAGRSADPHPHRQGRRPGQSARSSRSSTDASSPGSTRWR